MENKDLSLFITGFSNKEALPTIQSTAGLDANDHPPTGAHWRMEWPTTPNQTTDNGLST